jgi:XTP/dITP diphosphohydrolase
MPLQNPRKLVLATHNAGKISEITAMLSGFSVTVVPQREFDIGEAEETGLSFIENALLKARYAALHTGLPALAEDSGLAVDALGGAPGIYSARYAGVGATDADNNAKLLQMLVNVPESERMARFFCVMAFLRHAEDPTPLISQGVWEGTILSVPQGNNGFGYDPLFFVPTHACASAELPLSVKNSFSHRGQALRAMRIALSDYYGCAAYGDP